MKCGNAPLLETPCAMVLSDEQQGQAVSSIEGNDRHSPIDLSQCSWQVYTSSRAKRTNPDVTADDLARRVRQKTASDIVEIPTRNKFNVLTVEDEPIISAGNEEPQREPITPPIFIPNVTNVPAMLKFINEVVSSDAFQIKSMPNDKIKLLPKSPDVYRKIIKHMSTNKRINYTYQLKQERAYRVVLRNIHYSIDKEEIKDAIQELGHRVRNIINIRHKITKQPLSLFYIDLEPQTNNKDIFNVRTLINTIVKFEPPHAKREIVQCKRCQRYEHTKGFCGYPYRCVKCGADHPTDQCKKENNTPAKCALCENDHPANYKGCQVYQTILQRKGYNTTNRQMRTIHQEFTGNFQQEKLIVAPQLQDQNNNAIRAHTKSYAEVISHTPVQETTKQYDEFLTAFQQSFDRFEKVILQQSQQINSLLNLLTTFLTKLPNV